MNALPSRPDQLLINRLWLKGVTGDALLARLRFTGLLESLSLLPGGIGPAGVLCVRRLSDPSPGLLGLEAQRAVEWQAAVKAELSRLQRQAARPALERVTAGAEAVLFSDQAEMLACLALDCLNRQFYRHWWWQSLFPGSDPEQALFAALKAKPAYLPPVVGYLDSRGELSAFGRLWEAERYMALLPGLAQNFNLPSLAELFQQKFNLTTPADPGTALKAGSAQASPGLASSSSENSPASPWKAIREPDFDRLALPVQSLLGLALLLHTRPEVTRSAAFSAQVAAWLDAATAPADFMPGSIKDHAQNSLPHNRQASSRQSNTRPTLTFEQTIPAINESPDDTGPRQNPSRPVSHNANGGATASQSEYKTGLQPAEVSPAQAPFEAAVSAYIEEESKSGEQAGLFSGAKELNTRYGGIFYLVNLALYLELYPDFSRPLDRGLTLPLWDFVALVGEKLAGRKLRDDPVWHLLALLAGRSPGDTPGASFAPPLEWRLPPAWLEPFSAARDWRWQEQAGRLSMMHPAGFKVLDLARSDLPAQAQLEAELAPYTLFLHGKPFPVQARALKRDKAESNSLQNWLNWLLPYLKARLSRALGRPRAAAGRLLCRHPARLFLTASHLDVVLSLAGLPVEIRLSGLDRDPGWLPAAGRYLAFHFE
ncbi:MAG TPA: hypothetical protein VH186_16605 [Chloroflexia bacterium]|nr:hypothetical protein [Chloroflexia bacterium]